MDLKQQQLTNHLAKDVLAPVYCLSTDVTLLQQEVRDRIKSAATQQGFTQQHLCVVTNSFDWNTCFEPLQTLSLFAEKTLVDLRHPTAKWDKQALQKLEHYLSSLHLDCTLIISTNKLTSAQKRAQWFKLIEKAGISMQLWPVSAGELPRWIKQRLEGHGNTADYDALKLLADFTEGNLLATQQAIEKLSLLYPNSHISVEHIRTVVHDNAKFNVFDLTNYCLSGHAIRAVQVAERLKEMGTEPTFVLWSITREIRELIKLAFQYQRGTPLSQMLSRQWSSRKPILQSALKRLDVQTLEHYLQLAGKVDLMIKGASPGDAWKGITTLSSALAGKPLGITL